MRPAWTAEVLVFGAAAACLVATLLPDARRGCERARRTRWVRNVREAARGGGPAQGSGAGEELLFLDAVGVELASWGNIGGCGVGGGGGGGGVRWIGRRSPGGQVEVECVISHASGEDLKTTKLDLKVSGDVPGRFNVGVSVPYLHSVRHDPDYEDATGRDDPLKVDSWGDLSLLVSRKFGALGDTTANLTIGVPTAPYDVQHEGWWHIPYDAQPGRGNWTFSLGVEHTVDRDWGPMVFGGSYSYNGGENEIMGGPGDYKADSIAGYYYFSYRTDTLVHSLGANLSFALDKDRRFIYGEIDDQPMTLLSLQYGLEFQIPGLYRAPFFVSAITTLSEKRAESCTLALGVVTSF